MTHESLHETIEQTVELAAARASAKALSLNCRINAACKTLYDFDSWCVRQLITNLLANALEYTDTGSVTVTAGAQPSGAFTVTVEDTGPGIEPGIQQIMFSAPDQRESLPVGNHVGFGLMISKQLAEMMGATLEIESSPETGTCATVAGAIRPGSIERMTSTTVTDALRNSQALIVDGDIVARRLLEAHLRSWGLDVRSVLDIGTAIEVLVESSRRDRHISMVFVTHETDGDDLDTLLAALHSDTAHRDTMLVITGNDLSTGRFTVLQESTDSIVLNTPVRASELFDCISQHPRIRSRFEKTAAIETPSPEPLGRRVLLVEDNVVNQCVASEILKRIGVAVEVANNGAEALEILDGHSFDFVFMDCQMPEVDGFEATRRIRADARFDNLPVVALTANALSGDREACLEAGMNDYLTKPFTRDQLESMLDKWTSATTSVPVSETIEGTSQYAAMSLIDERALNEIRMLDQDGESVIFDEIVGEYLTSSESLVDTLAGAVEGGRADEVASCAHALKSSSAAVGLAFFGEQCARLEQMGREGRIAEIEPLWDQALVCYRYSIEQLRGMSARQVA
ncbi:MAG: response regulator [Pseudomonadota bacterium]